MIEIGHMFFPTAEVIIRARVDLSTPGLNNVSVPSCVWIVRDVFCEALPNVPFWTICCPEIILIGLFLSCGELGILEYWRFGNVGCRVLRDATECGAA